MATKKEELDVLKKNIEMLDLPLKNTSTNIVFGKGDPDAEIIFIGEAPGANEDMQGLPFVGRAGKQLDSLLNSIGLTIEDVYIANILKYRPPKNRNPNPKEIETHVPYLVDQISIIQPKVICTLGNFSTKFVLANFDSTKMKTISGITKLHGVPKRVQFREQVITVVPIYHPAAMLYNPKLKGSLEEDFLVVKKIIDAL